MGKSGQNVYKGINAQSWAALSLFLQYLNDPKFTHIELESDNFEDFNLVFAENRRIICESKSFKNNVTFHTLKDILDAIIKKGLLALTMKF